MIQVDMARGRPSVEQVALSMPLEAMGVNVDPVFEGIDVRNYGAPEGLPAARELLGRIAGVCPEAMIAWGNSSLTLMYLYARLLADEFRRACPGRTPRWIANTPGYDRHFAITEDLGIDLVSVPMLPEGPDVDRIREIISRDDSVIGMWCVPKHSNPCGTIYSDDCVRGCAALPSSGGDLFTIFWDNAYAIHDFSSTALPLLPIMPEAQRIGTANRVAVFCSTSKITFAGGGIAGVGLSEERRARFLRHLTVMSVCPDKVSQLRHVRFFEKAGSLETHMRNHAEILAPKFQAIISAFEEGLSDIPGVSWSSPLGGYFISLNLPHGTAARVWARAAERGIFLTKAGAAYPYGKDPSDSHLRIAPSSPSLREVQHAGRIIAETVREVVEADCCLTR